jgi:hypothetical protein
MASDSRHGDFSVLDVSSQSEMPKRKRNFTDMTIFGLRFCRRRKTDAEYIESIRNWVRHWKWVAALYGLGAALYFGIFLSIIHIVFSRVTGPVAPGSGLGSEGRGLGFGLITGLLAGYFFVQGGACLVQMLTVVKGQRTERLMLRFHDELASREQGTALLDPIDQQ